MKLYHLYNAESISKHSDIFLSSFESISKNIHDIETLEEADIYILDIANISKAISLKIKNLFEHIKDPLIYFDIPDKHSIMHVQLAVLLNSKSIITTKQDSNKLVEKIKKDVQEHQKEHYFKGLTEYISQNDYLLKLDNSSISFANEKVFSNFDCTNLEEVNKKLFEIFELEDFIHDEYESDIKVITVDKVLYSLKKNFIDDEKYIYIQIQPDVLNDCSEKEYLSTRLKFMELLKDKLLQSDSKENKLSLITLNIKNLDAINQNYSNVNIENLLQEMLFEVELVLNTKIQLSQYNGNFYLAFYENEEYESVKESAKKLHAQLCSFISRQAIVINIEIYAISLEYLELNEILNILNHIHKDKLTLDMKHNKNISFISHIDDSMSNESILKQMLETISVNNTSFKLLNIYKGLCVNTNVEFIQLTEHTIHLKLDNLQSKIVYMQKKSIFELPLFTQTIEASLRHINLETGVAIFDHFVLLKTNVNHRKHGRVICENKTSIGLSASGSSLKGDILDVSLNSIAFITPYTTRVKQIKGQDIKLNFELSLKKLDKIYPINDIAKVTHVIVFEEKKIAKIVCEIKPNPDNEYMIMDYVFQRQKTIIREIKTLVA